MKSVSYCCVVEQFFCCLQVFDLLVVLTGVSIVQPFLSRWKLLTCVGNNEFFIIVQLLRFLLHYITTRFTAWVAIFICIIRDLKQEEAAADRQVLF